MNLWKNLLPGKVSIISVLLQLLLLGCAIASEQQTNAKTLVIDVYSVKASDVVQQKAIALWAQNLREGKASLTEYPKILHADRPLGEAFDIANEAQAEDDAPKFVVAGHVAPRVGRVRTRSHFQSLAGLLTIQVKLH